MTDQVTTLADIQKRLKAPKAQRNTFGKYNYRTAEGIVHAFKDLDSGASLVLSDEITLVGEHLFVVATATLTLPSGEHIIAKGNAMHPLDKKGMDASQITGAASSYARKYALNGLFAIDDSSDDPDAKQATQDDVTEKPAPQREPKPETFDARKEADRIIAAMRKTNRLEWVTEGERQELPVIQRIEEFHPAMAAEVKAAISARKAELEAA